MQDIKFLTLKKKKMEKQRKSEIALALILSETMKKGMFVHPLEVKQKIEKGAKELGITIPEAAEFLKDFYMEIFQETIDRIDSVISSGKIILDEKEKHYGHGDHHSGNIFGGNGH